MRVHSLTTRFVLTLLLSTAGPFLLFTWFAASGSRDRLESEVVGVFLAAQAERQAERVDAVLREVARDVASWQQPAAEALADATARSEFVDDVSFARGFNDTYQLVVLVDADGVVVETIASDVQDGPTLELLEALRPERIDRTTGWFSDLTDRGGGIVWIDRHLSPYLHRNTTKPSRDPDAFSLGVAIGVPGARGLAGSLLVLVRWSRIQAAVDEVARRLAERSGYATAASSLVDGQDGGRVLAHSDRSRYGERLPTELGEVALASRALGARPFQAHDGASSWAGYVFVDNVAGRAWWSVVSVADRELFATSRELLENLLGVAALMALALVAWSVVASRAILRPVRRLAGATERIAAGDLDVRVPTAGRDELADLGRAFNRMAEDLATSREQLRDAERQAAWAEMARQVAHEIKNPLTPMRMSAQLLLRAQRDESERLPELIERVGRAVLEQTDVLARIASDFRQFAGPRARQLESISTRTLLVRVGEQFLAQVELGRVVVAMPETDVEVEVDASEIGRVFRNLVQNALAAIEDGGGSRVHVDVEITVARVEFVVRDDGEGIPESAREHLFEPYFTTRSAGTGLGLAICRRVVEAHGGTIRLVDSRPGRTEFRFWIPVDRQNP